MRVVIIGNGIAGTTLARQLRKRDARAEIILVSEENPYFFSRTALMYVYMNQLRFEDTQPYEPSFWPKNRIDLLNIRVESVDFTNKKIHHSAGTLDYDTLVLATGSRPKWLPQVPKNTKGIQGLYHKQDLENLQAITPNLRRGIIVGGGLIAVELAEMLIHKGIATTVIVREATFWGNALPPEEAQIITEHLLSMGVDLLFEDELAEVQVGKNGQLEGILTKKGRVIPTDFLGLAIGVEPNVGFLKDTSLALHRGVLVNHYFESSVPDVYAIGDCAEFQDDNSLAQIWYTGRIMGETLALTLSGERTPYTPAAFFNSAKFFEIEYQTYGSVPARLPEGVTTLFWQYPTKNICFRLNYCTDNEQLTGIQALGIRLRHEVIDAWLNEKVSYKKALRELPLADFTPEFQPRYHRQIQAQFLPEEKPSRPWWRFW